MMSDLAFLAGFALAVVAVIVPYAYQRRTGTRARGRSRRSKDNAEHEASHD